MLDPSLRLAPVSESENVDRRLKPQLGKTRKASHKKKLKVVNSSNNEARPLADILRLSDGVEANRPGSEVHAGTHWDNDNVWDASMLKKVVAFYVDSVTTHANDKDELKPTRFRVCFRMARDLALLQNDFYIDELLKVYDTSFKGKFISGMEDEQMNFELFLEQLVESHPTYRKYVDLRLRQHYTAPLSALDWLTQNHLRPHIVQRKRARARTIQSKTFWIWESIPTDMDLALEKLLPAIKKYMRVLGQFFLRQAVQSSSTTNKPRDYRMSSNAFISLMKQVRVFPQLFHRRELENAVRLSCCSSPETEKLNFPEFIETLVRCSCTLRWGELDGSKTASENNDDTVVVIKFVMLIFAMEGQGSVLKKRNEDVSAILGFLGQQQKKKQAEKLFRFRKMLADNKRRTRASRTHQIPSVWNQVRLHFSPTNPPSRSPTRSHDTFDELTESWDGGSPRRVSSEPFVFDAQTNQPFDIDSPHSPNADAMNHQQQSQPDSVKFVKNNYNQKGITSCSVDKTSFSPPFSSEAPSTTLEAGIPGDHDSTVTDSTQRKESTVSKECSASSIICQEEKESIASVEGLNGATSTAGDEEAMSSEQVHQFTTPSQSIDGLVEPMEKDDFLREILDSIGDVELMLSQPRFTGSNYSKLARKQVRRTLQDSTQDAVHADSIGCVPSLSELAGDTCSHLHDWQQISDIFSTSSEASEVQVRDPMLNHLTDIERFTESSDDTSLVAIAGMAGLLFTQDPAIQNHLPESNAGASQEIRPAEEIATSSQVSTHEIDKDTIK
ncbi:hypothetical protein PC129_g16786 [Phytophthora cactorum]|uniref:Uncharacterized protein n=1 Tax=Phytophthora cactorum TaxID=29920 RepID=A0A329T670_9STRA|nr:hypothetical protein Pcac1_g10465 [Phytophthora cactorum]KAG2805067.1 hypothetical protein PC112_g18436 [Phytophthora cactorum]KAG2806752.1 hypothetical protein PC111_g17221 [Phytophthora cactorum]KAG2844987.1 hypothetical protein PC113_g18277 [Phytophthora cactorum]KAG2884967.1 hypothetical protein PC114_g19903 [Phytophthora cactorum]